MRSLNKNIIIAIIVVVLVVGGGIGLTLTLQKSKNQPPEQNQNSSAQPEPQTTLQGTVTSVNEKDKYIVVKEMIQGTETRKEKEYKILIADATKIIKLELPFDPNNPPKTNTTFVPKQTEIKISGVKVSDDVFIKSNENFAGKNEVKSVEYIHILI